MEMIWFTLTGLVLYGVADRLLDHLEVRAGRRFEHRGLIFFAILLALALVTFPILRRLLGA